MSVVHNRRAVRKEPNRRSVMRINRKAAEGRTAVLCCIQMIQEMLHTVVNGRW